MNNQFNTEEQRIFVNSFYAYLNNHPTEDFVIDLDIVYKFIGFTNKGNFKRLLEKNFSEGTDYQIVFLPKEKNSTGRPNETIMLNVDTFKNICMIANTQQAKVIRTYSN
jgi:phage anti-repressor protein